MYQGADYAKIVSTQEPKRVSPHLFKTRNEGDEMISTRQTISPILFLIPVVFIFGVLGCSTLRPPDVEYVPTPHEVVAEMLNVAEVTKDDVVYDLGCGDGRIVIAAAKQYGARSVGVDIDPERIKESEAPRPLGRGLRGTCRSGDQSHNSSESASPNSFDIPWMILVLKNDL
jgi:SAM-dependent methyltransferase